MDEIHFWMGKENGIAGDGRLSPRLWASVLNKLPRLFFFSFWLTEFERADENVILIVIRRDYMEVREPNVTTTAEEDENCRVVKLKNKKWRRHLNSGQ